MVSHFEAEAQDDEDTELAMPDPDESGASVELNTCTDVALAGTAQMSQAIVATTTKTNHAVIDISLAKLFKCMNLAYKWVFTDSSLLSIQVHFDLFRFILFSLVVQKQNHCRLPNVVFQKSYNWDSTWKR